MDTDYFLFKNKEKIDVLRNYLYSNNLTKEEIDKRLCEFAEAFYIKGLDDGSKLEKETQKNIKYILKKKRDNIFLKVFNEIRDDILKK